MIRKLISRVFGHRPKKSALPPPTGAQQYGIDSHQISKGSRRVVEALQAEGYQAFIVGGAIRDLLVGIPPKDFDVATNATPDQVHRVFRRSRIIGRRFQIVHVMMGQETIEVTTFRGHHTDDDQTRAKTDQAGRVLRDNVFGTHAEDAARRDFTVNALYYDPIAQIIIDYHGGLQDIQDKTLRVIGDPAVRYREDPVRMLRALRLATKLNFSIEPRTRAPIATLAPLIENVPPSRLFDEMLKLLTSGHALACVSQLREAGLHHGLLPLLDVIVEQPLGEYFVRLALENTDARVRAGKTVSPSFLFATLLWHEVLAQWARIKNAGERPIPALFTAMGAVLDTQSEKLAITRRIATDIKEIWALQPRFEQRTGQRPYALLQSPKFRAGYDFLLLRAASGEIPNHLPEWWTTFMNAEGESRAELLIPAADTPKKRRRRPRRQSGKPSHRESIE